MVSINGSSACGPLDGGRRFTLLNPAGGLRPGSGWNLSSSCKASAEHRPPRKGRQHECVLADLHVCVRVWCLIVSERAEQLPGSIQRADVSLLRH